MDRQTTILYAFVLAYFTLFCFEVTWLRAISYKQRERDEGGTLYAAAFIDCVRFPRLQILTFSLVGGTILAQ